MTDGQLRRLFGFVRPYRAPLTAGALCVAAGTAFQQAGPWVLKLAVDDLQQGLTSDKLRWYGLLVVAVALAGGCAQFLKRRLIIGASRGIEFDIRNAIFAHLQRLPLAYYHANRTGDLMSRATNDLSAVRMLVGPAVMYALTTGLTFAVAVALMAVLNPKLTLVALLPLPLVTIVARYFGRAIHQRFERIQAQLSDLSAVTQEALAGVRVVRAYRREAHELERFRRANQEYVARNRVLIALQGIFYPSMGLLMGVSQVLVLWRGSVDVAAGRMTVGDLVAFHAYLAMLAWPMIAFGWVTNLVQRGRASWGRLLEVLDVVPAIDDRSVTRPGMTPQDIRGDIEFRRLTFSYGGRVVLQEVDVRIAAGQTLAIIGRTGSGKSTLLSLLARLHDPPPGTVFVDGIDVRELPLATLRGAIGFVPQEPFLFSSTIAENVAFGSGGSGRSGGGSGGLVPTVAAIARLDKDVAEFPQGYETRVGERGITLSGGQKQRAALARALYVDPRILILDDALSAVDTQTEEEILRELRVFMRARTSLIVSHRISTVRAADLILVMDDGRVIERGTHDELIEQGGLYAAINEQQLLEDELAAS